MKLLTKEIMNKLPTHDETAEKDGKTLPIILKLFNPSGSQTWYIVAATAYVNGEPTKLKDVRNPDAPEVDDIHFYGYVTGMACDEWGDVSYKELKSIKCPPFGLGIERDMYFDTSTLQDMEIRA